MGIRDACSLFDGFLPRHAVRRRLSGIYTESNIGIDSIVEQDRLLANDTHQSPQIMGGMLTYIHTIQRDCTAHGVIEPRDEVCHRRLTATGLSDECYRLPFGNDEIDIRQHLPLRLIGETDMLKGYLLLEMYRLGLSRFDDVRLGIEYGVDTIQRSHTATDAIRRLAEVFGWIDDRIEDNEVVNERSGINHRMVAENKQPAEP